MMPSRRADCLPGGPNAARPCPHVRCRHHLAVESSGGAPAETCSLDVADRDGSTLDEIGEIFGISREGVRQIEEKAIKRLQRPRYLRLLVG